MPEGKKGGGEEGGGEGEEERDGEEEGGEEGGEEEGDTVCRVEMERKREKRKMEVKRGVRVCLYAYLCSM